MQQYQAAVLPPVELHMIMIQYTIGLKHVMEVRSPHLHCSNNTVLVVSQAQPHGSEWMAQ